LSSFFIRFKMRPLELMNFGGVPNVGPNYFAIE
jgi:hypothetical protein